LAGWRLLAIQRSHASAVAAFQTKQAPVFAGLSKAAVHADGLAEVLVPLWSRQGDAAIVVKDNGTGRDLERSRLVPHGLFNFAKPIENSRPATKDDTALS
jgi:hypothetical protein